MFFLPSLIYIPLFYLFLPHSILVRISVSLYPLYPLSLSRFEAASSTSIHSPFVSSPRYLSPLLFPSSPIPLLLFYESLLWASDSDPLQSQFLSLYSIYPCFFLRSLPHPPQPIHPFYSFPTPLAPWLSSSDPDLITNSYIPLFNPFYPPLNSLYLLLFSPHNPSVLFYITEKSQIFFHYFLIYTSPHPSGPFPIFRLFFFY